jgi:hypothetical protein
MAPHTVRILLSWCHRDKLAVTALLDDLRPTLRIFTDVKVEWWQDSDLMCGEEFTSAIEHRIDEADLGLLLVTPHYLASEFITTHELPRFVGPAADKGAIPVKLKPLPPFGPAYNFRGLDKLNIFSLNNKAYTETSRNRSTDFSNKLAEAIRRRALGLNGYSS